MTSESNLPADRDGVDAERIAALLDGTLDSAQRAALLAELEQSEELRGLLADAVATEQAARAAADSVAGGGVAAARTPTRRASARSRVWIPVVLAAALVAVFVPLARRSTGDALAPDRSIIAEIGSDSASLIAASARVRSTVRGDAIAPTDAHAVAVNVGARLAVIEAMARRGDSSGLATARLAAREAAVMLLKINGGALAAVPFDALETAGGGLDTLADNAMRAAVQILGREGVEAGWWLETIRMAAEEGRSQTLERSSVSRAVDAIAADNALSGNARAEAQELARSIRQRPIPLAEVNAHAIAIMRIF